MERAEKEICNMVTNKRISAKINRMEWQVSFGSKKGSNIVKASPESNLEDWNKDLKSLLTKVEQTCHLINREKMVNK